MSGILMLKLLQENLVSGILKIFGTLMKIMKKENIVKALTLITRKTMSLLMIHLWLIHMIG